MNPGAMRHSITIKVRPTTQNSYGEEITNILQWNDFVTRYASVSPVTGREFYAAQQTNTKVSTKFTIRFIPGITAAMKVVYGVRTFNIISVQDTDERHITITLICEEVFLNG
jgi:SPP1 family predicted phage head-tail adaptor